MKYLKSFILFLLVSLFTLIVLEIRNSIPSWEKLPDIPSRPLRLKGIYSGVYYNIVVESENKRTYIFNDLDETWVDETLVDFPIDTSRSLMVDCKLDNPKIAKLIEDNVKISDCYQYYVQYNHDAADLIVVLDQEGNIWQSHEFLTPTPVWVIIIMILLPALILEVLYLAFESLRKTLANFKSKDLR